MPLWEGFIGPAYRDRSVNADAETCINLFLSTLQSSGNTKRAMLYGTPALKHLATVDTAGCRGWFSQDGRVFTVVGDQLYEKGGVPPVNANVDVLLVAGGGGGGKGATSVNRGGGGAGAGGMVTASKLLGPSAIPIVIGAGGAPSATTGTAGSNGGDTTMTGFTTAVGGGGGGSSAAGADPSAGGCGGGAGDKGGVLSSGAIGSQGFNGGTNATSGGSGAGGAGGGGMGSVGTDVTGGGLNPAGGSGLASSLSGAAVTYAAGGRGGSVSSGETGPSGAANSGNGGGGGGGFGGGAGGTGGSGVVILSYVTGGIIATGGTITNVGGRTIHTFTTNGTFTIVSPPPPPPSSGTPMFVSRGTIANDGQPVSFASNGRGGEQLLIVGGGEVKVFSLTTSVLSASIALPLSNLPVMCAFLDGYFLLSEVDTIRVWFSALEDGTLWDALDFFARSQSSDNVVGIKALSDKIWVLGSLTTDIYYDTGDADNPFAPYPASLMQEGAMSAWSIGVLGEALVWLSQDNEGQGRMVRASSYTPERISTAAIDFALASYASLEGQELLTYEQEGHQFAVWSLPNAEDHGVAWGFDARESALRQEPIWHQRADWIQDVGAFSIWSARGCCQADGQIYVGDRLTGDLYTLDLNTYANANGMLIAERTAPYIATDNQWLFIDQMEMGMEAGIGLDAGQGVDPVVDGTISRDGGHLWDSPVSAPLGASGDYNATASWYTCGRVRGDRFVFRVRCSDPVKRAWGPGLWVRVTPGSGQL